MHHGITAQKKIAGVMIYVFSHVKLSTICANMLPIFTWKEKFSHENFQITVHSYDYVLRNLPNGGGGILQTLIIPLSSH